MTGKVRVPGDKSISHRALMLGALAVGESRISGLLEGEGVLRTATAMRAMGAARAAMGRAWGREVGADGAPLWRGAGGGVGGLAEPADVLDLGNAGTGARLL